MPTIGLRLLTTKKDFALLHCERGGIWLQKTARSTHSRSTTFCLRSAAAHFCEKKAEAGDFSEEQRSEDCVHCSFSVVQASYESTIREGVE